MGIINPSAIPPNPQFDKIPEPTQTPFTSAPYNPLTQQHCDNCTKVIQVANDALQLAKKCRDCGYPVDDIIAQLQAQMDQATKIKQQFFPTSP
jgi:hypothetical protein